MLWWIFASGCANLVPAALADDHATHEVAQRDKQFSSDTVEARVGDRLELTNAEDAVAHHVFSMDAGYSFNEAQKPGVTTKVPLDHAGEFTVRCAIHPNMKLKVVVAP